MNNVSFLVAEVKMVEGFRQLECVGFFFGKAAFIHEPVVNDYLVGCLTVFQGFPYFGKRALRREVPFREVLAIEVPEER